VADTILGRLPTTLTLTASATLFSVVVGMASGIYAAVRRGRPESYLVGAAAIVGASIPSYFLALVLMVILGVELRLVPIAAFSIDVLREPETLTNLIMPTIALGAAYTALLSRITRASVLEVLEQDYVRTARAKGLAERFVVMRHAMRNALLPVITVIGLEFAFLLGGLLVTEQVFNLNGIGKLMVDAVLRRDYTMTQALIMLVATVFVVTNFLIDLLYAVLDPRINYT
jgi:peptide/nickel transport system permease protein